MYNKSKLNIAFIWQWEGAEKILANWRDGHRKVIELLGKKHKVDWFMGGKCPPDGYDFYLAWDDSNSLIIEKIESYRGRKGLMLTTNPHNTVRLKKYNVVFAESQPVVEMCKPYAQRVIKTMGTDTEFFNPDEKVNKDILYFYPATFSLWKKQSDIAHYGKRLTCIGTVQPDGQEELNACEKMGVNIEIGYFPAKKIKSYYNRAKNVVIPAIHGSERTVLEAMSMDIMPIVNPENQKAYSYIEEYQRSGFKTPRAFVKKYYSEYVYCKQLLKGIEQ